MSFSNVLFALTIYGSIAKNREKICMADFFKIPFLSKRWLVAIFAIFSQTVNMDSFIASDLKELESWD